MGIEAFTDKFKQHFNKNDKTHSGYEAGNHDPEKGVSYNDLVRNF